MSPVDTEHVPRIGMIANARNRRGIVSSVRPLDGPTGRLHLVDLEYNDGESPLQETLLWEREPNAHLLPPAALPDPASTPPMSCEDLLALIRACRWSARILYINPDESGRLVRLPVSSPFHGAVQVEDYQLMPLLKALRMPRVSLLIADDVGLGKTIEAGLIMSELLLRRRIRRVLILTPAALRVQWRDEMWEKFSLPFEIVDRDATVRLRRQMGLDANPWRSHARIISSYHYLKQADILEQFRAASQLEAQSGRLPWDLLIVDEAHNLTPSPFGDESDLCAMLRQVAPLFEHRLFLTATPHNGHTRSFTGLLEMLDPVRFSQADSLTDSEQTRVQDVLVRRLKREINARSESRKFCDRRPPQALLIGLGPEEKVLSQAFAEFRAKVRERVWAGSRRRRLAGKFAIEILGKRLLSCPVAFADSWLRIREGLEEETAARDDEVLATKKSVEEEATDDREAESRRRTAATTIGAWLRPLQEYLTEEIATLDDAVQRLGLSAAGDSVTDRDPAEDARYRALIQLIDDRLRDGPNWRENERLVVFTEYKTTLDYLLRRLRENLNEPERILSLWGGMDDDEREEIKRAFNDPSHPVRLLVATDAASEGLNLQETARYLLHYDVPWNPARLEQRNGRLDRHGQARDVTVWHFVSREDQDLAFLDFVIHKVDTIREDLGATGEVFDEITYRRLIEGEALETVQRDLDHRVETARRQADIPRDNRMTVESDRAEPDPTGDLQAIAAELDLDPETLRTTLDSAMALSASRPRISPPDQDGRCSILSPPPSSWMPVIDDTVRLPARGGISGPLPALAFDPDDFLVQVNSHSVFRMRKDTVLMHLAHPMFQRALSSLTRRRFPGGTEQAASLWAVYRGEIPPGADALIHLTVEQLAVNELRETFHHWVRTWRFTIRGGRIGDPLAHVPTRVLRDGVVEAGPEDVETARDLWIEVGEDVREYVQAASEELTEALQKQLTTDGEQARRDEIARYQSRQGEVSVLIEGITMARLEGEIEALRTRRRQGLLFNQREAFDAMDRELERKEEELERRRRHYEEVREQLARERERVVGYLIPNRYAMRGSAQVLPVAVEIILPRGAM